jgi:hypothetical protein
MGLGSARAPGFASRSPLAQQIPALVKLDLDLGESFHVLRVAALQPQPEALIGEPPDVTDDRVVHGFRS